MQSSGLIFKKFYDKLMKNLGKNPTHIRNYDEHVIYKKIL